MDSKFIYLPATDSVIATYLVADNLGLTKDTKKMRKVYRSVLEDFGVNASFLDEAVTTPGIDIVPFEKWKKDLEASLEEKKDPAPPEAKKEVAPPDAEVHLKEKPKFRPPLQKTKKAEAPKREDGTRKTNTLSALMAQRNIKMTSESFRTILTTKGILEIVSIPNSPGRIYRKLTDEGLIYGKNLRKDDGYKVRYYEDVFDELVKLVKDVQEKGK